jgi:hypothetical protein
VSLFAFTVKFARRLAPFRPCRGDASCQESASGTCYPAAASARLSARLACDWEDASCRPLQPTSETSTLGPFGSRAHGVSRADRALSQPKPGYSSGAEPRFDGGPTSGGRAIDVASPTSVVSTTARLASETRRAPRERGCLATVLSTACQAGDRPLTLSVVRRPVWDPEGAQSTEEPAPIPPPLRQLERHPRYRASSTDKCSQDRLSLDPSLYRNETFSRFVG